MSNKLYRTFLAVLLIGLLAGPCVFAWESGRSSVADIPFDFYVSNKLLPAGTYKLKAVSPILLVLKGEEEDAFAITRDQWDYEDTGKARLVFNRYGDSKYFLHEVWTSGRRGREVPVSRTEESVVFSESKFERIAIHLKNLPVRAAR